ncbi:odorant receptor 10-like [Lasioglossum baleicum]|uniref:odorant receptor 10-like n=1 Tax=Lasioglossum baleicum TaxID=434251 RepID=UPI003FCDE77E
MSENLSVNCSKLKMFGIDTDDFSISLASIFMKITGIWTSKNRIEQCSRTFAACYTFFMVALCIFVQSLELIRGGLDAAGILYATINVLCAMNDLFKLVVLFVYKKDFLSLVVHLQRQFLESQYDTNEKTILDACKSTCAIFIGSFTFFTHVTLIGYILGPLIVSIGKNESDRLFPFALPESPLYATPYYEITFFVQALLVYQAGICHFCVDNILCIMNLHVATQFRILQYRLSNLKSENVGDDPVTRVPSAAENSYMTFKRCVQHHKMLIAYCNKLEEVFNLIVFSQILIFSVLICVNGLQILVDTNVGRRYTSVFFLATFFVQLLMFTYSCDGLIQESLNVAPAVYSSPWACLPMTIYGKMLRKDVILVIMRSRIPCCLTAKGFFPISLETYTKVWSTAVSYFTLLRQTMDDLEKS